MSYSKNQTLNEILKKIDLTKTQRERAKELYTNLCKSIEQKSGLKINFYSQGSFATKTAIRPFDNDKDKSYDVDVICEVQNLDKNISPEDLMNTFEVALKKGGYHNYKRWDKCFTVNYAENDDVDFSIDIIPAVSESRETISKIERETKRVDLVGTSIAIPDVSQKRIGWISNNPNGYKQWFREQTETYERNYSDMAGRSLVASIEELPEDSASNMMRNVIKILKRLRDVYFSRSRAEGKPSSIVITTIVARIANKYIFSSDEFTLLKQVVGELKQLEGFTKGKTIESSLDNGYRIAEIISLEGKTWSLKNPANGLDNILSSWNENSNAAKNFFKWVNDLDNMINNQGSMEMSDSLKRELLYNSFNLRDTNVTEAVYKVNPLKISPWSR